MNPAQLAQSLLCILKADLVPFIQGHPGVGKSAIVKEAAKALNLEIIDLRLSVCDPTDLHGLPHFKDGKASFLPFDIFPLENTPLPPGKDGWILFLDEFNSAPRAVQAASYKLVLDRMVGMHKLHPKLKIVAAGNLMEDKAITSELSTAMQSRLIQVKLEADLDTWIEFFAIPNKIDNRIIAFLSSSPQNFMTFDPNSDQTTFACPRTWEFLDKLIKANPGMNLKEMLPTILGTVGSAAVPFTTFCETTEYLPSIDVILEGNYKETIKHSSIQWMLAVGLAQKANKNNIENAIKFVDTFHSFIKVFFARQLTKVNPTLISHPAVLKLLKDTSQNVFQSN